MELAILDPLARWVHVMGVVVWIGHNWANAVQAPRYLRRLPAEAEAVVPGIAMAASKREHGAFRYASLVVLATGLFMLAYRGLLLDALSLRGDAAPLGLGVWLGLTMAANLWFVLWPHQKKVLGFVPASAEERLRCTRLTFLSSRTNTILSIPTLFFMTMGAHGHGLF